MKRNLLAVGLVMVIGMFLVGCSEDYMSMLDYESAEDFEAAINNGDDVEGAYVMVEVNKFEPASAFGFNVQAGEHLNFVDAVNPNAEEGDFVVFEVEKIANMMGSYIITYKEHKVIDAEDME